MDRTNRNFSLSRAIEIVSLGRGLEGAEAEWAQEARKEMQSRGLQMTGQIGIPEQRFYVVAQLTTSKLAAVTDLDTFLQMYQE
jgi:hypothetical protein